MFASVCTAPESSRGVGDYSPEQLCFYDITGVTTINIKIRHWTVYVQYESIQSVYLHNR